MKHRLFILFSCLSLLLCTACILIWLRSHFAKSRLDFYNNPPVFYRLETYPGSIALERRIFPDTTLNNRPGPVVEHRFLFGFRTRLTWFFTAPQLPDGSWTHGTIRE